MKKTRIGTIYRYNLLKHILKTNMWDHIVDIGSHDDYVLSRLSGKFKVAVDMEIPSERTVLPFVVADAKALPFKNNAFDLALMLDVIEHIADENGVAQSISRVLKQKGILTLSTPSVDIQLFPRFLTKAISLKWGHFYRLGYSQEKLFELFSTHFAIKIYQQNSSGYRFLYLLIKAIDLISQRLSSHFLQWIARIDLNHNAGTNGFYWIIAEVIK
ncbi:MAG: class I SAM-dependent methyltransferase [Chloroflexi bacterium]|nr:class I SAM-dependent methyltransferase [Chloroflexota bacterium]